MARVMIVCPVTERLVPTRVEVDEGTSFRRAVPESGTVDCQACKRRHGWFRAETLLEGDPTPRGQRRRAAATGRGQRTGWVLRPVDAGGR